MKQFFQNIHSEIEKVAFTEIQKYPVELFIKRDDKLHPQISGNKFRKLKYNLLEAKKQNQTTLLTFGGAFSNHIAATAAAGNAFGFKTIGVIRGDELAHNVEKVMTNPTLKFAKEQGMAFHFVSRANYRKKTQANFIKNLKDEFGDFYLVPEGGTNTLAVKGCEEILSETANEYNVICSSVGTGGTISGLINASKKHQTVIGFPALKGNFLHNEIEKYVLKDKNWSLNTEFHFGGYGKILEELIRFMNNFKAETNIPLDPIYTGKMMYGIVTLIKKNYFPEGSKILAIHTGGLQGIEGINNILKKKNLALIK